MENKLQQEDTVSADRKERIIFDDKTGKSRKTSAVTSRQNFNDEKFTRRKNKGVDDEELEGKEEGKEEVKENVVQPTGSSRIETGGVGGQSDTISKDKPKKSNNSQIQFVTGTAQVDSMKAFGNANAPTISKKIAEAIIKKGLIQVSANKNTGMKETDSCNTTYSDKPAGKMTKKAVDKVTQQNESTIKDTQEVTHYYQFLQKLKRAKLGNDVDKIMAKEETELDESTPNKQQVKQAIGIARDKRYAGGNMTGAVKAMDKLNKGLAQHPRVADELKKQNEEVELEENMIPVEKASAVHAAGQEPHEEKWVSAKDQMKKKKTVKEGKTFSDFIREMEFDKNGRYVHKGTYGSSYKDPEGADEHDEKPSPEKRGRGRPKGALSGANQKVSSGKKGSGVDYTGFKLHLPNNNR
jgi:hypothetical protein